MTGGVVRVWKGPAKNVMINKQCIMTKIDFLCNDHHKFPVTTWTTTAQSVLWSVYVSIRPISPLYVHAMNGKACPLVHGANLTQPCCDFYYSPCVGVKPCICKRKPSCSVIRCIVVWLNMWQGTPRNKRQLRRELFRVIERFRDSWPATQHFTVRPVNFFTLPCWPLVSMVTLD